MNNPFFQFMLAIDSNVCANYHHESRANYVVLQSKIHDFINESVEQLRKKYSLPAFNFSSTHGFSLGTATTSDAVLAGYRINTLDMDHHVQVTEKNGITVSNVFQVLNEKLLNIVKPKISEWANAYVNSTDPYPEGIGQYE